MAEAVLHAAVRNANGSLRHIVLTGRLAWALRQLIDADRRGCTPLDHPGPRWSAYVHKLRHEYGLDIETIHEAHGGPFAGTHARYVLHTPATPL